MANFLIHFLLSPLAIKQPISVNCYLKAEWCGLEDDALELKGTWLLKSARMSEAILRERQARLLKAMLLMTKSLQESETDKAWKQMTNIVHHNPFISYPVLILLRLTDRFAAQLFAFWSHQSCALSLWFLSAWNLLLELDP